jgi:hypothetical protein
MIQEKELICRLKEMRSIEPSKDWVSFNKRELFKGEEQGFSFLALKPAFAGVFAFLMIFGIAGYGMVKNSMPGDLLYSVRKAAHFGESIFVSDQDKTAFQLSLANDRLEDLVKASSKNLTPTMNEFEANISEAVRTLGTMSVSTSSSATIEKIVKETKKLEENKEKVEALGVVLSGKQTSDLNEALKKIVGDLIADLEERALADGQAEILAQMKEIFEQEKYYQALELYLLNQ